MLLSPVSWRFHAWVRKESHCHSGGTIEDTRSTREMPRGWQDKNFTDDRPEAISVTGYGKDGEAIIDVVRVLLQSGSHDEGCIVHLRRRSTSSEAGAFLRVP
jgi:hypothetical protein